MKKLFVSGVGRSGTSALVNVLNSHASVLVGQERFFWAIRKNVLTPEHFEKERFLDVRAEDTHNRNALVGKPEELSKRYDRAEYVGDKYPSLFRHFDHIFDTFPEACHLYILRNPLSVLESYDARHKNPDDSWSLTFHDGMEAWNESIRNISNLSPQQLERFVLVGYEDLYSHADNINRMFARLGLAPVADGKLGRFVKKFASLNETLVPRRDDLRSYVARNADWDTYRKLCDMIERADS